MGKIMLLPEIETRFESEWVLLEDPITADTLQVKGGKVPIPPSPVLRRPRRPLG